MRGWGPDVACQTSAMAENYGFLQAPMTSGSSHMHLAVVDATGQFRWDDGNIPGSREAAAKDIVLNYAQNYNINGWTIWPSGDGTRFTNDTTGHGMLAQLSSSRCGS